MRSLLRFLPFLVALLYLASPLDLIPDVLPVIGWVDDLLILAAATLYLAFRRPDETPWRFYQRVRAFGWRDPFRARTGHRPGETRPEPDDDPYAVLGLRPGASPDEIRAAYRKAVAKYHPDKVAHLGKEFQDLAHWKLLAIQRAHEVLLPRA